MNYMGGSGWIWGLLCFVRVYSLGLRGWGVEFRAYAQQDHRLTAGRLNGEGGGYNLLFCQGGPRHPQLGAPRSTPYKNR